MALNQITEYLYEQAYCIAGVKSTVSPKKWAIRKKYLVPDTTKEFPWRRTPLLPECTTPLTLIQFISM